MELLLDFVVGHLNRWEINLIRLGLKGKTPKVKVSLSS